MQFIETQQAVAFVAGCSSGCLRSLLAGELAQAQSFQSDYFVRLEIQNGSGTWIDVGAALGKSWIVNATWGEDRDTPVAQATFTLVRNIGAASLAPLMSASVLNVDDTMAYSPLLNIGRLMRAFTATTPWNAPLAPPGAVGYWPLDGDATDQSGNGNNATLVGAPPTITGKIGTALSFDGSTQQARITADTPFRFTSDFSLAFWMTAAVGLPNTQRNIMGKYVAGSGWDISLISGHPRMTTRGTSQIDLTGTGANLRDGLWHHIVAVNTPTSIKIYQDGVLTDTLAGTWTATTNTLPVIFGGRTTGDYSPFPLDDIRIYGRALSPSEIATLYAFRGGDYRPALTGRITDVFVLDDAEGRASMITLPCSDLGGWLMDLQIETDGIEYGNPTTPPALESVLQAVIDANIPVGEPAVTLVKQSSSSFGVTGWKQGETKLLEALRTLVLDSTGEDLRYRFDSSHVSQLMWFNPDRSRVTVDATFTKDQYRMSRLDLSLGNIRNAGSMAYIDSATGTSGVVTAEDATSIGAPGNYRRRYFRLPSSKMLATEAESQTVIDAVVNDLSGPPAEAQVQLPFSWYVQLYDRYMFEANGRQYDQDQTFAVGGYQHSIENGRGSTVLTPLTSRIVGAYAAWSRRLPFLAAAPPVLSASFDATGQLIINSSGDFATASQKIAWATGSTPSAATVRAATPIAQQLVSGLATGSVYPAGTTVFVAAFAYSANGLESTPLSAISVSRQGGGVSAAECLAKITGTTATTVTVTVTANPPSPAQQVQYVGVTGGATLASGTALGTWVTPNGTNNVWVFNRAAINAGVGQAQFRAGNVSSYQNDDDFVPIEEQGRDTVYLAMRARTIASNATTATVRVAVADPFPQGAGSATIAYTEVGGTGTACAPASGSTVTPAATLTEAAGTYIDYTVTRPAFATGTRRVTFTATAANRTSDSDAVDVPAVEQDTNTSPPTASVTQSAITAPTLTTETLTITGALGTGGTAPLTWRYHAGDSRNPMASWSAWLPNSGATLLPYELAVTRALKYGKLVEIQVSDAGGLISTDKYTVQSKMEAIDEATGNVKPGSVGAGALPAGVTDDRNYALNSHFNTAQHTLDDVPDATATTYKKTLATRVNLGRPVVDFTEAIHTGKSLDNIADTGSRFAAVEAGADSTAGHVSADTAAVSGRAAATVKAEAIAGNSADTDLTAFHTAGDLNRTTKRVLRLRDVVAGLDVDGATARYGYRLVDTLDALKLPASETTYTGGATVDSLKPAAVGADVTGSNTSAAVGGAQGTKLAGIEPGANVTETRTALDTANVDSISAATARQGAVRGNAALDASNLLITGISAAAKYADGVTGLDARKPAEGGANVTETRTSADTAAVSGRAAGTVKNEAIAGALADTDLTAFGTSGYIDRTLKRVLQIRDATAGVDVSGAVARYGYRLVDTGDALKLPATETTYTSGATVDSLKPAAAGADVTSANTAAAVGGAQGTKLSGIAAGATVGATWGTNITSQPTSLSGVNSTEGTKLTGIAAGADVTGSNTSAAVGGAQGTKLAGIAAGADVTSANTAAAIAGQGALATKSTIAAADVNANVIGPGQTNTRNRCRLNKSGGQSITSGALQAIVWDNEQFDVGDLHNNSTNNTRITVPTGGDTGVWLLMLQVEWPANATGLRLIQINDSAGNILGKQTRSVVSAGAGEVMTLFAFTLNAPSVGTYFEAFAQQTSGVGLTLLAGAGATEFSAIHNW